MIGFVGASVLDHLEKGEKPPDVLEERAAYLGPFTPFFLLSHLGYVCHGQKGRT